MIPGQSRLFLDYLNDPESLRQFYPNAAGSVDEIRSFVPVALAAYRTDRAELCRALSAINQRFGCGTETEANIRRLALPDTVAVVTGQQAGLFTGPLYTIYKALSACRTAEALNDRGISAVPVFWIATEDHDFDEVSHAEAVDRSGSLSTAAIGLGENTPGKPVGNISLVSDAALVVGTFINDLPETQFTAELRDLLAYDWNKGQTIGMAFGTTLARILSRFGLILLDPMDSGLKRLASPLYVQAIENSDAIVTSLVKRGEQIINAGYHNQVLVTEDYFPLFWHTDFGVRSSLRKIRDGVYYSKDERREFTVADMANIADREPERFSPGVMLRPVVQDFLLPNVCYLGGGAEIAYFAQNSEVYRVLGRPVTPIFHRQSFTVVESRHARTLKEYDLGFIDLFNGFEELVPQIVERYISPETAELFRDVESKIDFELDRLGQALSGIDVTLADSLIKRRAKIAYHITTLQRKAYRAEIRRNEVIDRRIRSAMTELLPIGTLQERVLNFSEFYNKYGPNFFDWIYAAIDADQRDHQLIYL